MIFDKNIKLSFIISVFNYNINKIAGELNFKNNSDLQQYSLYKTQIINNKLNIYFINYKKSFTKAYKSKTNDKITKKWFL